MSTRLGICAVRALFGCAALVWGAHGSAASLAPTQGAKLTSPTPVTETAAAASVPVDSFLDDLEGRTFRFFWETANPHNGLIPDRYPGPSVASIAAVGFGLTAYPIGVERGLVSADDARQRVLATLHFFLTAQNQHGFYYHFLDMRTGARAMGSEVSTVDTALLLAGMLFCETYFNSDDPRDVEIRKLTDEIYRRTDWTWAQPRAPAVALAWTPESGFSAQDWSGYNEAMLVYLLALGSPSHPISADAWTRWTSTYDHYWGTMYDQTYLCFAPLFGHQYSHVWVDFRGIRDAYMRAHDLDYFENSRRATYTQRRYAIANPKQWQGYGKNIWGISASDGPGHENPYLSYAARGVGLHIVVDDGTIAPTAALSSLPFAPEIVLPAAHEMYQRFGTSIYSTYGFYDAFNVSYRDASEAQRTQGSPGWVDPDYLGIDQGPILAMIENYRSDLIWRVMRGSQYVRDGLERAGFSGGWLVQAAAAHPPALSVSGSQASPP